VGLRAGLDHPTWTRTPTHSQSLYRLSYRDFCSTVHLSIYVYLLLVRVVHARSFLPNDSPFYFTFSITHPSSKTDLITDLTGAAVEFYTCIREVLSSNLDERDTGYPD
jgi:hypothetical protein